jgi:hypothetical protein
METDRLNCVSLPQIEVQQQLLATTTPIYGRLLQLKLNKSHEQNFLG